MDIDKLPVDRELVQDPRLGIEEITGDRSEPVTTVPERGPTPPPAPAPDLLGIVVVAVPVTDLARSAAWYRDLLDLHYVREFGDEEQVTGCALADFTARYLIALRLRSGPGGGADLHGEHPMILEARDAAAAERVRDRATALGIGHSSGCHADGTWTEFTDPDGICLRVVHDATGPRTFLGVRTTATGEMQLYESPRLALPTSRRADEA